MLRACIPKVIARTLCRTLGASSSVDADVGIACVIGRLHIVLHDVAFMGEPLASRVVQSFARHSSLE